jgi:hypothetical protein
MPAPERTDSGGQSQDAAAARLSRFNVSKPNIARVYDYWLGGKDHFAADRELADRLLAIYPSMPKLAMDNRKFLTRAVTWVAGQGIRQFLDIGSGLPTGDNTHEAARAVDGSCRVIYADNDPVVISHARALPNSPGVEAIDGDLGDPMGILGDPVVCKVIRPGEPACVVLGCVLHFFDFEHAWQIAGAFVSWVAPGSYVIISVGCGDDQLGGALTSAYTAAPVFNHSPGQVIRFFDGLELVPPGLVDAEDWRPPVLRTSSGHGGGRLLAGVARKPG